MHVLIPPTSYFSKFWGFLGSIWGFCCISCFQRNWQVWANIWDPKRPKQVINSEFIVYFLCHTMNLMFLIPQVSLRILGDLNSMICYLNVEFRSLNLCVFGCLNNPLRVPQGSPKTGRDGWGNWAKTRTVQGLSRTGLCGPMSNHMMIEHGATESHVRPLQCVQFGSLFFGLFDPTSFHIFGWCLGSLSTLIWAIICPL